MTYQVEVTDTFGGEANYSWVRRYEFDAADNASNRMLVRRAKNLAGWNGQHSTDRNAGCITVTPHGLNMVMFILAEPQY